MELGLAKMSATESWSKYPLNISNYDPMCIDGDLELERIENRSKELFDCTSESSLELLENGGPGSFWLLH